MARPLKKTATLEIRLPHSVKDAFMERCRKQGASASDVLRASIDAYLAAPLQKEHVMKTSLPRSAMVLALISASAILAVFVAHPSRADPDFRATFNRLDRNHDGVVSVEEFQTAMSGDQTYRTVDAPSPMSSQVTAEPIVVPVRSLPPPPAGFAMSPIAPDMLQASAEREFARMDQDRDAKVSFAEFEASQVAMLLSSFSALDANHNGRVTAEEFASVLPMSSHSADPTAALARAHALVGELDANHDGAVDWPEFSAQP